MQLRRIAHAFGQLEPNLLERRALRRIEFVARIHVAEFERPLARQPALHLRRQFRELLGRGIRRGRDVLGTRHFRHRELMLALAFFRALERCGEEEDRLAVLDRGDAAHGEAAAVARAVDEIDDRMFDVARAQEGLIRVLPADRTDAPVQAKG